MRGWPLFALAVAAAGCTTTKQTPTGADAAASASPATASTLQPDAAVLNALTVPQSEVEAYVNRDHLPAYSGPTGSVEGTIRVHGPPPASVGLSSATFAQCPDAEKLYSTSFREGPPDPSGKRPLSDAVVVVTGYNGFFLPEKKEAALVNIVGCGYEKRTIAMTYGQRLEVKNLTKEYWTPDLDPRSPGALMMAPPNGDAVKLYPKKPGRYHLIEHDRKYVIDDVVVLLQPLHDVSDAVGHYRIDGVPVGTMRVSVWHPQILNATSTNDVTIKQGVVATVDLTLNYNPPTPSDAGVPDAFVPYPGLH